MVEHWKNIVTILLTCIIGIGLIVINFSITPAIPDDCDSEIIRNANKALLISGTIFCCMTVAIMLFHGTTGVVDVGDMSLGFYSAFCFFIGGGLMAVAGLIQSEMDKKPACNYDKLKSLNYAIWGIASGIVAIWLFSFIHIIWSKRKKSEFSG